MWPKLHKGLLATLLVIDLALILGFAVLGDSSRILNNAIDIWFDQSDITLPAYKLEQQTFGKSSWIYVNLWSDDPNADSSALTSAFRKIEGVTSVLSPHDIDILQSDSEGSLFFDTIWPEVPWRERHTVLSSHPVAHISLISAENIERVGFLLEESTGNNNGGKQRQQIVSKIRTLLDSTSSVQNYTVTGPAIINAELNRLSWRDFSNSTANNG